MANHTPILCQHCGRQVGVQHLVRLTACGREFSILVCECGEKVRVGFGTLVRLLRERDG